MFIFVEILKISCTEIDSNSSPTFTFLDWHIGIACSVCFPFFYEAYLQTLYVNLPWNFSWTEDWVKIEVMFSFCVFRWRLAGLSGVLAAQPHCQRTRIITSKGTSAWSISRRCTVTILFDEHNFVQTPYCLKHESHQLYRSASNLYER